MGLGGTAFTVLTEFKFEAGSAIAQSQALQGVTQDLANSAKSAQFAFQSFSTSLLTKFNLPMLGAVELIKEAVFGADKLENSLIDLANLLGTVSGASFVERMEEANSILIKMKHSANEFALPVEEMFGTFKQIFAINEFRQKGAAGQQSAMNISRMFQKSAPTLGVDTGTALFQLQRAIQGQASMGDTLFVALTRDTKAMAEFSASSQKWNSLAPEKRIKVLTEALGEFSRDASVLSARVNTLKGQMNIFRNNISGMTSVLTPFGNEIRLFFVNILKSINKYLETTAPEIFKNLGKAIGPLLSDPRRLFAGLTMFSKAQEDLSKAGKTLGIAGGVFLAKEILKFFGISFAGVVMTGLKTVFGFLGRGIMLLFTNLGAVFAVFNFLTKVVSTFLVPLLLLHGVFQLISRAIALAKINVLSKLAEKLPILTEAFARFSRIFDVFDEGFNTLAEVLAPVFEFVLFPAFEFFIDVLNMLSKAAMLAVSSIQGIIFAFLELFNQTRNFFTGKGFNGQAIGTSFNAGIDQMIQRIEGKLKDGEATTQSVVNVGEINQKFEFKQEMEPDRIAFTVKDQLQKVFQNPVSRKRGNFVLTNGV